MSYIFVEFDVAPHDIILLKVVGVQLTDYVNTVCLPDPADYFPPEYPATVAGWGKTYYEAGKQVNK